MSNSINDWSDKQINRLMNDLLGVDKMFSEPELELAENGIE